MHDIIPFGRPTDRRQRNRSRTFYPPPDAPHENNRGAHLPLVARLGLRIMRLFFQLTFWPGKAGK